MLNGSMWHSFGGPNQVWDSSNWTNTEWGQLTSQASQDCEQHLTSVPTVPLCQYDTHDYSQLLDTELQQSRSILASWGQPIQNIMPPTQQAQPVLPRSTHGGATDVAPTALQLPMTGATSNYLSTEQQLRSIPTQSGPISATSSPSLAFSFRVSDLSRSASPIPNMPTAYGFRGPDNSWSCAWPGCTSRARFTRACDLRKHYNRHSKTLFCRHNGCPQSREAGFSNKKDRARHETKHNPRIKCKWEGCGRLFGRLDNMVGFHQHHLFTSAFADSFDSFRRITYEGCTRMRSYRVSFAHRVHVLKYGCCLLIDATNPRKLNFHGS